jgi:hypothetical protein
MSSVEMFWRLALPFALRSKAQLPGICPNLTHQRTIPGCLIRLALHYIDIIDFIYLSHKATISPLRAGLAVQPADRVAARAQKTVC